MLFHLEAILTQPSIATVGTRIRTTSKHWALTGPFLFVSFPRASAFRPGRAVGAPVPAHLAHGYCTVAPRSGSGTR
eukprot:6418449-Pyramimonas_sp.AAC.1